MVRTLQDVQTEIHEYRQAHGRSARLPTSLRKAVVRLCDDHTRSTIITELGVGWSSLTRWAEVDGAVPVARTPATKTAAKVTRPKKIEFVEIKTAPHDLTPKACRKAADDATSAIEVARPDGWTVRVTGALAKDFADAMLGKFTI